MTINSIKVNYNWPTFNNDITRSDIHVNNRIETQLSLVKHIYPETHE